MYSSSNYLYRRPSNASDSSSVTLTDDKCYGITNSNYNNYNYNNYLYNSNDEEYKNLPYTPSSYSYDNGYDSRYNSSKYNYALGSSSFPNYNPSSFMNNYESRRGLHSRSLSVGNTPNTYGNYNYDGDDGVYRDNNHVYITSPSRRHMRYSSGGSFSSFFRRNRDGYNYNHTNPIDYLDLPVDNYNDYYSRRRRRRSLRSFGDYYPERKKSLLENLTSKFKKLRFGSSYDDKYDDYYDDDYRRKHRYSNYLRRNSTLTNTINNSMTNLDNSGYNSYNNSYYNNNNYNNYNNYNDYNTNYNNNYNNQNDMYSSYLTLNNSTNDLYNNRHSFTANNRSYSDFTSQPPAQQLVKAPTVENNDGISSYYNSWNNNSSNYLYNNNPYNVRNSDGNLYNYSSSYNDYSTFNRSNSVLYNRNHSRHNSLNNIYDRNCYDYNSSSRLYDSYNNQNNDNYYNNNVYITNDNLASDNDNFDSYRLRPYHRRRRSNLKEYVDSNYYNNNDYDGNPKYYRSRQPSKVTFDRNVQYWSN